MSKPKTDYGGMIDLPDNPAPETVQENDRTPVLSYDRTNDTRPKRGKRATEADDEGPVYIQRSLYATDATFERIRQYAFKERMKAQEIYREGLLLVMKKYGIDEGVKLKDV